MGNILSCHQFSRNKSKSSKTNTTLPSTTNTNPPPLSTEVQDVQRGLADEHLAAIPPPSTRDEIANESHDITRNVGVTAPAPVPTAATASNSHRTNGQYKEVGKDKMASDEDYMAFLDKANRDPNEGAAEEQSTGKVEFKATDKGASIPQVLKKATEDAFYVSDADEPFVPVSLKLSGKSLPDEVAFAKLVNHPSPEDAGVEVMNVSEWDPQGQYKDLVEAVREACKGSDVKVYRITKDGSRVEYWVVGVEGGKLVGAKALAIES